MKKYNVVKLKWLYCLFWNSLVILLKTFGNSLSSFNTVKAELTAFSDPTLMSKTTT